MADGECSSTEPASAEPAAASIAGSVAVEPTIAAGEPSTSEASTETLTNQSAFKPKVKHDRPGRPRKEPLPPRCLPVVSVVGKDMLDDRTNIEYRHNDIMFCLSIPDSLLVLWHKQATKHTDYLSYLNGAIEDGVVAIREDAEAIAHKLYRRAGKLSNEVKKKAGRGREALLGLEFILPVCAEEVVTTQQLQAEIRELKSNLASAVEELALSQDAIESMTSQLKKMMAERDKMVNCGKKFADVGKKQRKRKLAYFQSAAEGALWFAESFGLIPECVNVRVSGSEDTLMIPLIREQASTPKELEGRRADEAAAVQTLYLLDRFGISDEFYHELTQVSKKHTAHTCMSFNHTFICINFFGADSASFAGGLWITFWLSKGRFIVEMGLFLLFSGRYCTFTKTCSDYVKSVERNTSDFDAVCGFPPKLYSPSPYWPARPDCASALSAYDKVYCSCSVSR